MDGITIKVAPETLVAEAEEVLNGTQRVEEFFGGIKEAVERSRSYWQGDAADMHRNTYAAYADEISAILKGFRENARSLKEMAQSYQETEREVQEMAQGLPADIIY